MRWNHRVTTTVKSTNLFNRQIQRHVFGDVFGRSVTADMRVDFGR